MQISFALLFAAVFATAAFADTGVDGSNTNIGDTDGLLNNVLADGLLNDNSQKQANSAIEKDYHHGYRHHRGYRHHGDDRYDEDRYDETH